MTTGLRFKGRSVRLLAFAALLATAISAPQASPQDNNLPGEGEIWVNGRIVKSLQLAFDYVTPQGIIRMGPGVFKTSGVLGNTKHNVTLTGTPNTWLDGVALDGKAAITNKANNFTMRFVNCRNIAVKDKNGSCVRHEGGDLTIEHVHFKDSESGVLSWNRSGKITIRDCIMENIGKAGRAHGVYLAGEEVLIERCRFIGTKDEAHSIKSRAQKTTIRYSVIASGAGNDSRLIDIPNGGRTIIRDNLLVEGANTVNFQILSWGVETNRKKPPHADSVMRFVNNTVITDRRGGSELILVGKMVDPPVITGNAFIGEIRYDNWPNGNYFFKDRAELGLPPAPEIPEFNVEGE